MASCSRPGNARGLAAAALVAVLLLLSACGRSTAPGAWAGDYRVALQLPGGELPFGLELRDAQGRLRATLVNGEERIEIAETSVQGERLTLRLPGLQTELTAQRMSGGRLEGAVTMIKQHAVRQVIPLVATRGSAYGFFADVPAPTTQVTGRWAVTFTEDDGAESIAVGEFRQDGTDVHGTFLTPTADHRYLSGQIRGDQLFLRSFNGGHAFLYHLRVTGEALTGDYWSGLASHARIAGHRDENASLGDAENAARMKPGEERLTFRLPDLSGRPVSLDDERFRGKVVVVTLGGSWCPNCHDEAAFFTPWYRELAPLGLEIVGLMFEQSGDRAEAVRAVERFRDRYSIDYPLLIAGENDREQAQRLLPQLSAVLAYPTTIFIDRAGKVRRVHTGFAGPATGVHYDELRRDFDRTVRDLLAENP
jgi:peroxiredoxin